MVLNSQVPIVAVLLFLTLTTNSFSQETPGDSLHEAVKSRVLSRVLAAVDSAKTEEIESEAADLVPLLIMAIEADTFSEPEVAIRALARMKSRASLAAPALCQKLHDKRHWIRSSAVDALVEIGADSVAPVQDLLTSESPLSRANAAEILGRQQRLSWNDTLELAKDVNPTVRAAAARFLSGMGKPAVPQLVDLLSDPEQAVGVAAAQALAVNQEDSSLAVPGLIQIVPRVTVGRAATDALADYGVKAQRAIPTIIKSFPLVRGDYKFPNYCYANAADVALTHIGPPHLADLPLLCECLKHGDFNARILALESIGRLGREGEVSATALQAAADAAVEQYIKLAKQAESRPASDVGDDGRHRICHFAELSAVTLWRVTRDGPRFLALSQSIASRTDSAIYADQDSPWSELGAEELPQIEKMLQSENPHVRETALHGVSQMEAKAAPLKHKVRDLCRDPDKELRVLALTTLVSLGTAAVDVSEPALFEALRNGKLQLNGFASAVETLKLSSPEILTELETVVSTGEGSHVGPCARALCSITREPRRIASLVMHAIDTRQADFQDGINGLRKLKSVEDLLVPYYTKKLIEGERDEGGVELLEGLADLGDLARPAVPEIQKQLQNRSPTIRLLAAKALFIISKDSAPLQRLVHESLEQPISGTVVTRYDLLRAITDLNESGSVFLPFVIDELRQSPQSTSDLSIDALAAIGTPAAIAAIEEAAQSTDWVVRSYAHKALQKRKFSDTNRKPN